MNKEPCIICEREAICSAVTGQADTCEYRCEDCGNYFFRNDQNREEYEKLDSEERERILKRIRADLKRFEETNYKDMINYTYNLIKEVELADNQNANNN